MCNLTGFRAMSLTDSCAMILNGGLDVGEWSCTLRGPEVRVELTFLVPACLSQIQDPQWKL